MPHTLSADGDPIDVLVCNTRALFPGAVINCRPVGVLVMQDEGGGDEGAGGAQQKADAALRQGRGYSDLPAISLEQIEHFFAHYKDLEPGKWVKIDHWGDKDVAERLISEAIARAKSKG